MEVKVVVSIDDRTASLLENLINALGVKVQNCITAPAPAEEKEDKEEEKTVGKNVAIEKKATNPTKVIGLEHIRGIARHLADNGRQAEYREILKHYGYEKVNQIKEEDYVRIYNDMFDLVDGEPF